MTHGEGVYLCSQHGRFIDFNYSSPRCPGCQPKSHVDNYLMGYGNYDPKNTD